NPNNFTNNVTADLSSNINYTKTFTGTPFSFGASMRHSQSVQTGEVQLSLPTMNLSMNRQSPFKNMKFEPLKTLNIAYNFDLQNSITNKVTQEFGVDPELVDNTEAPDLVDFTPANFGYLLQNANNGARNRIPISSN